MKEFIKGNMKMKRLSWIPQKDWDEIERADNDAMDWIDEFRSATPERRYEMSEIEAYKQDKDYGIVSCSSYEQFKHCREYGPGPDYGPRCKHCKNKNG